MTDLARTLAALDPKKRELLALLARREGIDLSRTPIAPVPRDGSPLPLSFAQERLWFLDQLVPGDIAWNLPSAVRLRVALDPGGLARVFAEIVRRHEVLRTAFRAVEGRPGQVISPPGPVPLPVVDLSGLAEAEGEGEARRLAVEEAAVPFDLERGPVLRVRLLRLAPADHVLLATLHHIASDAWSTGLFVEEVAALVTGSPPPELPVQYADFAAWQREALRGPALEAQLGWWRTRLAGLPPALDLPADRQRPPVQRQQGVRARSSVPAAVTAALKTLAQGEDATLFMVLLAGLSTYLQRITAQDDLCVGTPVAGRRRVETERLLGFFVNTLPIRVDLSGDPPWREALGRVRLAALGAFEQQDVPFERIVEEVHPGRDLARTPLFQVVLSLQNAPRPADTRNVPGLAAEPFLILPPAALYDLTLTVTDLGDGLTFALDGNADLFEEATMRRMAGHLETLLAGLAADPDQRLSELPLLTEPERRQILEAWSGPPAIVHAETGVPLAERIARRAAEAPEAPAIFQGNRTVTYGELWERARQAAQGIEAGSLVAVQQERSPERVAALLGCVIAGAAYLPAERGAKDSKGTEALAYVIYTSGSTGVPKGVEIPHTGLANLIAWHNTTFGVDRQARATHLAGLGFDAAVWEIWPYLAAGASIRLLGPEVSLDAEALAEELIGRGITHAFVPTPLVEAVTEALARRIAAGAEVALRFLLTGGDRLQRGPAGALPFALINCYGPTESTVVTTAGPVEVGARQPSIGRPIAGITVRLLDRTGGLVPVGVPGELAVGGAGLARGYRGRPELTAERFVPDPFGGTRLYRTGDLARWQPDGTLDFLGRIDAQVKIRGIRVEPGEVEAVLAAHPAVREAAVLPRETAPGDLRLAAWVVPARPDLSPADLRRFLAERLPEAMVPAAWAFPDRLPVTPNGKIDRRALAASAALEPVVDADVRQGHVPPRTSTEAAVAALFAELLGVERVGAADDFFALGGHSLLASRLAAHLRDRLGVAVPVRHVFAHPTVEALARWVDGGTAASGERAGERLAPAPAGAGRVLSFGQQRLWFLDRMEPGSPAYNIPLAVQITGALDPAALAAALGEIERRHEVLRTSYPAVDGRATPDLHPHHPRPLPCLDLSRLPEDVRLAETGRVVALASALPFDLAQGPVWRALLLVLGAEEAVVVLTLHHIAADGGSLGVLLRELGALYTACAAGRPSPLPPLPLQYADFALWQRHRLSGELLAEQLAWWRARLAGLPPFELPVDRPRPPVQTWRGAVVPFTLGASATEALRALARRRGATPFMALGAAFQVLLRRVSGRDDVVIGTPVAAHGAAEAETLVGLFTNLLVLRTDLAGEPTFLEALDRARETTLGALAHQDLPFERLVEELKPARDLSRPPLFQILFSLQSTPQAALDLPGLTLRPLDVGRTAARYDLALDLVEGDGIGGTFERNADLFDAATIHRLAARFHTLLEGIVADPGRPLADLPLLPEAEEVQLRAWNGTAVPVPAGTVHGLIAARAARTPEALALISGRDRLTCRELLDRVDALAARLRTAGVGPEDRVGVSLPRSADLVVALLGVMAAGAAYVPLDPGYPAERIAAMVEDSGARLVLTDVSPGGRAGGEGGRGGEAAYVLYTSGSTGRPKGVTVTHANVLNFFAGMDAVLRPDPEAPGTWLAVTSASFDISVLELLWTLARGFTVVVEPDRTSRRPIDFSLFYFAAAEGAPGDLYRLLLEGAKFADSHGFAAVWTPERHFHEFGGLYPNPSVTGAALAGVTERVAIRAGSVVLPLHNPFRVAEEWALVDNLSHGRIGVSFASGWHVNDFVLAPEAYADRKERMFRQIAEVRRLWRGETIRVPDGTGQPVEVSILPRPVQPELPVWVTAAGHPETFREAGAAGAHLLTHLLGQSVAELAGKIALYRQARRAHDGSPGHVTLMLHTFVGDDLEAVRATVREPMKRYLRSSVGLLRGLLRAGAPLEALGAEELEAILDHAFERYFEDAGLFGTPASCLRRIEHLRGIGVDEIACLIDFGVETQRTLAALAKLDELRQAAQAGSLAEPDGDLDTLADRIRRHGVTHLQCTPSLAGALAADPDAREALGTLHTLLLGGEALSPALAAALPRPPGGLFNLYGPTETTVWSTVYPVPEVPPPTVGGVVPIGRPIANTAIYLVDPALRPVPPGSLGELVIGGAGVARGYLGRPDLTAERFVPDPSGHPPDLHGARLYRTGDLARHLPDGTLEFHGRLDQQVKIRGHRIEPGEIEAALCLHPGVRACVVVARREPGDPETRLLAYLVPAGDAASLSAGDLRTFLLGRLPEALIPSAFLPLERLPLTPNGKIDRRALPAPDAGRLGTGAAWVEPQSGLERTIAGVWREVLRAERVGVQDNFFELGGTSLGIAQVHGRLREALGRDLSLVDLFRHPTVGALARHLAAAADPGGADADARSAVDDRIRARTEARARRRPSSFPGARS